MCEATQHGGNGPPHPLVSWPESLLSAGHEGQGGGSRRNCLLGNQGSPRQAALVQSTVLHMPPAPRTALIPASPSMPPAHGQRVLTGRLMAVTVPAAGLVCAEPARGDPQGLLSLAGDAHRLQKPQRDPSDVKGGSTSTS